MAESKKIATKNEKGIKWDEHVFLNLNNQSVDEIESATLSIRLLDKGLFKDKVACQFDIDVAKIYSMSEGKNKHVLMHQWMALINVDSVDPDDMKGFLKASISVEGPGDKAVKLQDDDPSTDESNVMMPPSIKRYLRQFRLTIMRMEGIPTMDVSTF
jgi:hypothetical protein